MNEASVEQKWWWVNRLSSCVYITVSCLSLITELIREWLDLSWHRAADSRCFVRHSATLHMTDCYSECKTWWILCKSVLYPLRVPTLSCLSHWFIVNKSVGLWIVLYFLSGSGHLIWGCLNHLEFMSKINKTKMLQMPCFDYRWICPHLYALLFNIRTFLSSWVSAVCFRASPSGGKETPLSLFQVFQLFIVFLVLTFQWFALEFLMKPSFHYCDLVSVR